MNRKVALLELLKVIEGGEDIRRMIDLAASVFPPESGGGPCTFHKVHPAFHGSLDAAKALHETVLPDRIWIISARDSSAYVASIPFGDEESHEIETKCDGNPVRAWLTAILKALIAMEGYK
ncbi:hypothetical protein [Martelella limonii]|uniref:hypothetical protein n=1 Tax=Martelella limonii TaxID=1647649 RepID=UPI0015810C14|nr:hypothetical protein [Martelella limonii]